MNIIDNQRIAEVIDTDVDFDAVCYVNGVLYLMLVTWYQPGVSGGYVCPSSSEDNVAREDFEFELYTPEGLRCPNAEKRIGSSELRKAIDTYKSQLCE